MRYQMEMSLKKNNNRACKISGTARFYKTEILDNVFFFLLYQNVLPYNPAPWLRHWPR